MVRYKGVKIDRLTFVSEAALQLFGSPEAWSPGEAVGLADVLWDELSMRVAKWNVKLARVEGDVPDLALALLREVLPVLEHIDRQPGEGLADLIERVRALLGEED